MSSSNKIIPYGRFAPSPTGHLHLGSLYTALASFLSARSKQGKWFIRIDDLDTPRNVKGSADSILFTLDTYQLHWDDKVAYQSKQLDVYEQILDDLTRKGLTYPCVCSRKTLSTLATNDVYPGICRDKQSSPVSHSALRIKTDDRYISFKDGLQGHLEHCLSSRHGDFILKRKDQLIAYQFAVVIDDFRQHINEVVRGFDLLDSTPRQIYLHQLLAYPVPDYMHLPVIVDQQGYKLSKQTNASKVDLTAPERVIFKLLNLLKQNPPPELEYASLNEQLGWAVSHWNPEHLIKVERISLYKK